MPRVSPEACAAFVGLDGADATHDVCLQAAGTARRAFLSFAHRPEVIDAWVQTLRTRCHGHPVAVCLDLTKGPMVSAWRHDASLVLFPVRPLPVARYRDACIPSRATDDPTDAALQVALLLKPRDKLQPLRPHRPAMRALTPRVEHRRRLVGDTVRCPHRLTRALTHSFPQVRPWLPEKETAIFGDVRRRWPTLTAAPRARRTTLESFFRAPPRALADVITTRIEAITTRQGADRR